MTTKREMAELIVDALDASVIDASVCLDGDVSVMSRDNTVFNITIERIP